MNPACIACYECGCHDGCGKCERACFGKSDKVWLTCLFAPFALVLHSFYAYFWKCIMTYIGRVGNHFFCYPCVHKNACNSCYIYKDKKFKPDDTSLGIPAEENIVWKRANEVLKNPVLFQKSVEPSDVMQGSIGNCWLMSAFACMAEFPGLVDKIFINREKSTRGKYQVSLYNGYDKKWQLITVDDMFPVKEIKPAQTGEDAESPSSEATYEFHYARPQDNELWVVVLEKAFAKFRGSYHNLVGGNMIWAFHCLTGDNCFRLRKCTEEGRDGWWERMILAHDKRPNDPSPVAVNISGESINENKMFDLLRAYDRSKSLLGASVKIKGEEDKDKPDHFEEKDEETGLVRGHAYSVLQAKRVKGDGITVELVQLRNPWAYFEWKGDWSDESPKWTEHPAIAQDVGFVNDPSDGTFWMCYQDFIKHFDNIDICDRTVDYTDFTLDVHENPDDACKHFCGPTQGCIEGCTSFWCKCRGIKTIYCGNESTIAMKKATKGRDDTFFAQLKE